MGGDELKKRDLSEGIRTQASEPKIFEQAAPVETLVEAATPRTIDRSAMPPIPASVGRRSAGPTKSLVEGLSDELGQRKIHEK